MNLIHPYGLKSRNIFLLYVRSIFSGMLFFAPILALYLQNNLFTVTNVALVFSIKAISIAIFEYPTGAVADLLGRKKSLVFAGFTFFLSIVLLGIGTNLTHFIIYAITSAFAFSLFSGTGAAMVYDTLKQEGKEKYYKKIIGIRYSLWPIGASIGSIIGGYLAAMSYSYTIWLTLIPASIAVFTTLLLEEPKYEKENHKNIFKHMYKSLKIIVKNNQLIILLVSALILVGTGDAVHSLKPIFYEFWDIPIIYFGYILAVSFALSSLGHYFSHEVSEKFGNKRTILVSSLILALFVILATFVSPWLAVGCLLAKQVFYGLGRPATDHLINLETESKTRATVISGYNFMRHSGIAGFTLLIGWFADIYNINTAFRIAGLVVLLSAFGFLLLKEKN